MKPRRIGFLAFDGMQALDLTGPADAFGSDALIGWGTKERAGSASRPYEIVVIGLAGSRFTTSSGVPMHAHTSAHAAVHLDTLIVPGGAGLRVNGMDRKAADWVATHGHRIRRIASVCTGLYGLAPTGLLDGCEVTTHWSAVADIARRYPKLKVQPDRLFVKAHNIYTAAGITAGIDLALALIEEDLGRSASLAVAREMVVYLQREGGQGQFSEPLQFQHQSIDRFADLASWICTHLREDLSIETLARRAYLSPRQFTRVFTKAFATSPAVFVEGARVNEAARRLASAGRRVGISQIARSVGYASDDVFRRAFERHFRIAPAAYRHRFTSERGYAGKRMSAGVPGSR